MRDLLGSGLLDLSQSFGEINSEMLRGYAPQKILLQAGKITEYKAKNKTF